MSSSKEERIMRHHSKSLISSEHQLKAGKLAETRKKRQFQGEKIQLSGTQTNCQMYCVLYCEIHKRQSKMCYIKFHLTSKRKS